MRGLMQDRPLAVPALLDGMERRFRSQWVSSRDLAGVTQTTYGDLVGRVRRLAGVLQLLAISPEARVATFGWNSQRHLELYVAVPATGRILHTVNHRLFVDQLEFILNDAQDEVVFVDRSILGTVWPAIEHAHYVRHVVVMDDGAQVELPDDRRVLDYETLMASAEPHQGEFAIDDERRAAGLCYTSGTTGNPKGVLYDHRSIILHALMLLAADSFAISRQDTVMPVVPMFHVNAWGLPYACLLSGANLSLPGPQTDPAAIVNQLQKDDVTVTAAVPTVWRNVLPHLQNLGSGLPNLRVIISGGSAVPPALAREYHDTLGIGLTNAWGMTETSPVVTTSNPATLPSDSDPHDPDELIHPGPNLPLTVLRLRCEGAVVTSDDGTTHGELEVAGSTIAGSYFGGAADLSRFTDDGWLRTGDIATIDPNGHVRIVDRTKDVIKSGGEWISSVELENAVMAHPAVAEAAVIARPDDRWSERPVACVVLKQGHALTADELGSFLTQRVARWWVPEDVVFLDEIPKTATGKFSKLQLKRQLNQDPAMSGTD